ncbi:HIT domain-containing protein [Tessaracoccus terricola]
MESGTLAAMAIEAPYEGDDFYCDVALPNLDELTIVHLDEQVVAYHHTRPFWETHVVVVPRAHVPSFTNFSEDQRPLLLAVLAVAQRVAADVERTNGAAAVLTNLGTYQDSKHLHVHVHSGARLR